MTQLFLQAAKHKYRFKTPKGSLTLEDLFDLSETELNALYISLAKRANTHPGLMQQSTEDTENSNKMKLVELVFNKKKADREAAEQRAQTKELNQKLMEVAATRKFEELTEGKSSEEIMEMVRKGS